MKKIFVFGAIFLLALAFLLSGCQTTGEARKAPRVTESYKQAGELINKHDKFYVGGVAFEYVKSYKITDSSPAIYLRNLETGQTIKKAYENNVKYPDTKFPVGGELYGIYTAGSVEADDFPIIVGRTPVNLEKQNVLDMLNSCESQRWGRVDITCDEVCNNAGKICTLALGHYLVIGKIDGTDYYRDRESDRIHCDKTVEESFVGLESWPGVQDINKDITCVCCSP